VATTPRTAPSVQEYVPQSSVFVLLMTLIALVPFCSVLGLVLALVFGWDRLVAAVAGALLGGFYACWKAYR
jgi:hypothetical protein